MTIKIADFGLSKIFDAGEQLKTACGTPDYVGTCTSTPFLCVLYNVSSFHSCFFLCKAPEILMCKPYSNSVDIWSVGIITYILLCGFTPFFADTHKELFDKIMRAPFEFPDPEWTDISPEGNKKTHHSHRVLPLPNPNTTTDTLRRCTTYKEHFDIIHIECFCR